MGAIFLLLWILLLANVIVRVLSFSGEVQCPSLFLCVLRGSCVGKPVAAVPWVQVIVGGSGFWDQPTQAYSAGTESASNAGDPSWIPGSGRSPGGGHGNPLKYSCLENPHGQRSLAGYSPWGHRGLDMTERLSTAHRRNIWSWKNNETVNLCVKILNEQWQLGKQSVSEERLLADPWVGFMPNRYWNRL